MILKTLVGLENRMKWTCDGGPSLSMISSSIKTKGKLNDIILEALNSAQNRGPRTASSTAVQWPVRHPRSSPSTLPDFVVQIS